MQTIFKYDIYFITILNKNNWTSDYVIDAAVIIMLSKQLQKKTQCIIWNTMVIFVFCCVMSVTFMGIFVI